MSPLASLDDYGFLEISPPVEGRDMIVETDVKCTYQPIQNDKSFILGPASQLEFNRPTLIPYDQFVVQCRDGSSSQDVIYERAFVNIPLPTEMLLGATKGAKVCQKQLGKELSFIFEKVQHGTIEIPQTGSLMCAAACMVVEIYALCRNILRWLYWYSILCP
ncbi:unnamed protein product [Strongylus vulgaris]|uniref:Uncharacterized protein n=1 Tax=Strongylus vulgaris TaxID=40348 RepID=A0A3P7ILJ0_STRVU|nr:unnamed protein product [Strongylus vulgaris]